MGHTNLTIAMLLATAGACAQSQGNWVSYRDAYKRMVVFEKYGKPKQHLQNSLQVVPLADDATLAGLALTLHGKGINLRLPLDATGRAELPLLKAAYDDNATLQLSQEPNKYAFRPRVTIARQADNVYDAAELREACEQALDFERHLRLRAAGSKCVAVRFAFAVGSGGAHLRHGAQVHELPLAAGPAFPDVAHPRLIIATYRFDEWPEGGQLVTRDTPLSISAEFN